jgi:hypothetical protein
MSNDKSISQKCKQLYEMSKKKLEENDDPDLADEVIVALWEAVESLQNDKAGLQKIVGEQQKTLATQYHQLDILNTRLYVALNGKLKMDFKGTGTTDVIH